MPEKDTMTTITGPLHLYSETGTEGGHWAIQDEKFITPAAEKSPDKHCQRCGRWWKDAESGTPEPPPHFTYYKPDRVGEDGVKYCGGYHGSDVPIEGGQTTFGNEPEGSFNDEWTKRGNALSLVCYNEGHDWDWAETHDQWSYEGLNVLRNGDVLTVYDKADPTKELFTVPVKLLSNYDQYREGAKHALGWVIHNYPDPEHCFEDLDEWSAYFLDGYPARLVRTDND